MEIHPWIALRTIPLDNCRVPVTKQDITRYVKMHYEGKLWFAHRLSYFLHYDEIDPHLQIDHVYAAGCRYKGCVLPEHLEQVTQQVNLQRAHGYVAEHCSRGHELTEANSRHVTNSSGGRGRACRICDRDRNRANYYGVSLKEADRIGLTQP